MRLLLSETSRLHSECKMCVAIPRRFNWDSSCPIIYVHCNSDASTIPPASPYCSSISISTPNVYAKNMTLYAVLMSIDYRHFPPWAPAEAACLDLEEAVEEAASIVWPNLAAREVQVPWNCSVFRFRLA